MTASSQQWQPAEAWRRLRLESEAAQHYHLSYSLYIGQTHRDILLERLLPTLLHLKAVAILDDAIELWLDANGHQLNKPYRNDLNGRLCYLDDHGLLAHVSQLHDVRRRRNEFAHEPGSSCDWAVLRDDISSLETALVSLGLAQSTPQLEYFSERSAMQGSDEPGISFMRTFRYGVKAGGKEALEIKWTQKFHED